MARSGKKRKYNDTHHIIPRSRCAELKVNPESKWNKITVNAKQHEFYHALFGNKTPHEAFDFLLKTFWNGVINPPKSYRKKLKAG